MQKTVSELKAILRLKGFSVSGNKNELIGRLVSIESDNESKDQEPPIFTDDEYRAKLLLEKNGIVGNCGHLRTREHFDEAVSQMGGLKNIFEIFKP